MRIDGIALGRQVALTDGRSHYEPLARVADLPSFPCTACGPARGRRRPRRRAARVALVRMARCGTPPASARRGIRRCRIRDPSAMASHVCRELIAERPEWRAMVDGVSTTATQALQLWLRSDEPSLGWRTRCDGQRLRASVQHLGIDATAHRRRVWPESIGRGRSPTSAERWTRRGRPIRPTSTTPTINAKGLLRTRAFRDRYLPHLLPGHRLAGSAVRWDLLCGTHGERDRARSTRNSVSANVDPSDRYVQSRARIRSVPTPGRRERLRQLVPRRRLDRQRTERWLHRSGHTLGPTSSKRRARTPAEPPHRGLLPRLRRGAYDFVNV